MTNLKFGTAGLRGVMGKDIDTDIIKRATQGLALWLLKSEKPKAVISYDSRRNSRAYAEAAASVLSANGVETYLWLR